MKKNAKPSAPADKQREMPLTFTNYKLMLIVFNEEMFSFRRITLAPLLVLFGFAFEIYAIMKKPEKRQ